MGRVRHNLPLPHLLLPGPYAAHALRWHLPPGIPERLQQQCRLAQTLVAAYPDVGAGLLEAWLLPVSTVGCHSHGQPRNRDHFKF